MRHTPLCIALAALAACSTVSLAATPAGRPRPASPRAVSTVDLAKQVDVNQVGMVVTNVGTNGYDYNAVEAGLEFPRGSGKHVVFSSGLWLSGNFVTSPRLALGGYSEEFLPGAVIDGVEDEPNNPDYRTYKLDRSYASTVDRDAALAEWNAGAVPHGAQPMGIRPDGTLGMNPDQLLWNVYNDLDAGTHHNPAGRTAPLAVEVQQAVYAFNQPGALEHTVFLRFRIINRNIIPLTDFRIGMWVDPDIGAAFDDLTGCDPATNLAYAYNSSAAPDSVYGANPPAVGFDVVQGPMGPGGTRLGLASFCHFVNGAEPDTMTETISAMKGLQITGAPFINPTTNKATTFQFSGDPVGGTGWRETVPTDQRMLLTTGPISLDVNEQQDIVIAIIVAQGSDALSSLALLRDYDAQVQAAFDSGALPVLGVGMPQGVALALDRAWPNPSRGVMHVRFGLAEEGSAQLDLIDVNGRRVLHRDLGSLAAGSHEIALGNEGQRLPAGTFFARLTARGQSVSSRVVVLP